VRKDLLHAIHENMALINLTILSIAITAYLAYTASSPAEAVALALLASACQILAGVVAVRSSKPDPSMIKVDPAFIKSALARLADIGVKGQAAWESSTFAREKGTAKDCREILGSIRVTMGFLQDEVRHALDDWKNLAPEVVISLEESSETGSSVAPSAITGGN
jgi:hypothetical protein